MSKETHSSALIEMSKEGDALFCIEVLKAEIFIPDEYVVIRRHDVRMQKPFSIPPCDENHNQLD